MKSYITLLFISLFLSFHINCDGKSLHLDDAKQNNLYVKVTGTGVRLRYGPGLNYNFLKNKNGQQISPQRGAILQVVGEESEWWLVRYNNGNYYISKQFAMLVNGQASGNNYNTNRKKGIDLEVINVSYDGQFKPTITIRISNNENKILTNVLVTFSFKNRYAGDNNIFAYEYRDCNFEVYLEYNHYIDKTFTPDFLPSDYLYHGYFLNMARFSDGSIIQGPKH